MSSIGKLEQRYVAENTPYSLYVALGPEEQPPQVLAQVLQVHRDDRTNDKNTALSHAAVCIELAYEASSPKIAGRFLDEAQEQFEELDSREDEHRRGMDYVRRGALLESFMPRIRRITVDQEASSLHDERAIWLGAVGLLADSDLKVLEAKPTAPIVNAEIAIHALTARNNLRRNDIWFQTWQTLPRTAFYSRNRGNTHHEWNVGLTKGPEADAYQRLIVRQGRGAVVRGLVPEPTLVANLTEITDVEPLELLQALRGEVDLDGPRANALLDHAGSKLSSFAYTATQGAQHNSNRSAS